MGNEQSHPVLDPEQEQQQSPKVGSPTSESSSSRPQEILKNGTESLGSNDDDDGDDEDEWYSMGSIGSITNNTWDNPEETEYGDPETTAAGTAALGEHDVFPYSSSPPSAPMQQGQPREMFHSVVALREAQEKRAQASAQCCLPRVFAKPQPLWLDFPSASSLPALDDSTSSSPVSSQQQPQQLWLDDDESESSDYEGDEDRSNSRRRSTTNCIAGWNERASSEERKNKKNKMMGNNQLGMLLWAKKQGSSTTSLSTAASSSMPSCGSYINNNSTHSSSWSVWNYEQLAYTPQELALSAVEPTPASDLRHPRHVWIVTTASLPWMTGTAVNPVLRAGSLWNYYANLVENSGNETNENSEATSSSEDFSVTLVLPWLCRAEDRVTLYGEDWEQKTVQDQEDYIRQWVAERANMPAASQQIAIQWYAAHYHPALSSIFAVDDVCDACTNVPENAVCVLEEPEHLNCYRAPGKASWRQRFSHVVGIVHTNYRAYAQAHASGLVTGPLVGALFATLVQAYCDKVIKLSDVLQSYAPEKEVTSNVHGIRQEFLSAGAPTGNKAYFIGKLLWAKGLDKLLILQSHYKKATGNYFDMDIFGSGPEQDDIAEAFFYGTRRRVGARRRAANKHRLDAASSSSFSDESTDDESSYRPEARSRLPVSFQGRLDHASMSSEYKIFINPSITEVLCTTTAEALAMGKFALIPKHPSNHFFAQFPNCLQYHSKYEFCVLLTYALNHTPTPLSEAQAHVLTWEAATDRLFEASAISRRDEARRERLAGKKGDERLAQMHEGICKGTSGVALRTILHGKDPHKQTNTSKGMAFASSFDQEEEEEEDSSAATETMQAHDDDGGSINSNTDAYDEPSALKRGSSWLEWRTPNRSERQ